MTRWDRFNLDMPDDFPVHSIDSLHAYLSDRRDEATQTREWGEWASGLNGLVFRFRACDEHVAKAIESLRHSASPPQPERYQQEKWLFAFFVEGLSAFECFAYALYFVGALAAPTAFTAHLDPKRITLKFVARRYAAAFAGSELATQLSTLRASVEFDEWSTTRNILGHRGAPGRHFYSGGPNSGSTRWKLPVPLARSILAPSELERRREWFGTRIASIAEAADRFAAEHVP